MSWVTDDGKNDTAAIAAQLEALLQLRLLHDMVEEGSLYGTEAHEPGRAGVLSCCMVFASRRARFLAVSCALKRHENENEKGEMRMKKEK